MEVRGEERGESGCFMGAMSALLNTIRNRLRPERRRQRTKNYRICHNSAMAKKKPAKEKKLTWAESGLNTKPGKPNRVAKGTPANSEELQERLKSSVQAFQQKRKPRWVLQTRADLQPAEPASQAEVIIENTQAGEDLNPAEQPRDMANMEITQPGENPQPGELDLQGDEPASWVVANAQMWTERTSQDGPVLHNMPIMHSGPDSSDPVTSDWTLEHLTENLKSSANKEEGDQAGPGSSSPVPSESALDHLMEGQSSSADETGEDIQPNEPPSWGLTPDQMYRDMTGQDRVAIMYSGPFSFVVPPKWAFDHLMSGVECEEQDSCPYTMVFY